MPTQSPNQVMWRERQERVTEGWSSREGVGDTGWQKITGASPLHFLSGDLYTKAAEAAMEAMKGRLANQYYEKAEEAWAQMEE